MIELVSLEDFISHRKTSLELGKGLIVFVGHNGAGKSSVIDAITFAFFGKHTRGRNSNLVRYGASRANITVELDVRGKRFRISRSLSTLGRQHLAELYELRDGKFIRISSGATNVSPMVEKLLGVSFDELILAGIIRQGELEAIINLSAAEARERIDRLVGFETFEHAYKLLNEVSKKLKNYWTTILGYEPSNATVNKLKQDALILKSQAEKELKEIKNLERKYIILVDELKKAEEELEKTKEKQTKLLELKQLEKLLKTMIEQRLYELRNRVHELSTRLRERRKILNNITEALKISEKFKGSDETLRKLQEELENIRQRIEKSIRQLGELQGLVRCISELKPVDGKCPLCGSPLPSNLKEFPLANKYKEEFQILRSLVTGLKEKEERIKKELSIAQQRALQYIRSQEFLSRIGISRDELIKEISGIEKELQELRIKNEIYQKSIQPLDPNSILKLKSYFDKGIVQLADKIMKYRNELKGFSHSDLVRAEEKVKKLRKDIENLKARVEALKRLSEEHQKTADNYRKLAERMEKVVKALSKIEEIREKVLAKHSRVLTSLRRLVLREISKRASEYLKAFDLPVFGIEILDEPRIGGLEIRIISEDGIRDIQTLSGGERIAVALAIRLGIAHVISRGKLDFIILDEPTTHLDYDRRRALLRVISNAFRKGIGPLRQVIIITHDEEILEEADIDKIFKFKLTSEGTKVELISK